MTTARLDVLTVAGHLRLDGLEQQRLGDVPCSEQQRLGDVPCSGRVVYALNGIERNPAPHSILGLSWGGFRPGPRRSANQQTRRGVSDAIPARERGPIVCTGMGDLTVHRRLLRHGRPERRLP